MSNYENVDDYCQQTQRQTKIVPVRVRPARIQDMRVFYRDDSDIVVYPKASGGLAKLRCGSDGVYDYIQEKIDFRSRTYRKQTRERQPTPQEKPLPRNVPRPNYQPPVTRRRYRTLGE